MLDLEQVVRLSPHAMAVLDTGLRYELWSERWRTDIAGDRPVRARGLVFDTFPEPMPGFRALLEGCLEGSSVEPLEVGLPRGDGAPEWIRWHAVAWNTAAGVVGGVVVSAEVITAYKRADEALRVANTRLREAQRLARLGYWDWRLDTNLVTWSDEVYELFGVDRSKRPLSYEDYFSAVVPEEKERVSELVQDAIAQGQHFYFEHRIARPDGSRIHVAIDGRIESDADGKPAVLYGAAQDVTERKELEEQLRQSQKMEAIGRLAGGVAHDLNNILTALFGFGEFALEGVEPGSEPHRNVEDMLRVAQRAKTLTQQLLAFSRQQPVIPRVVSLNACVRSVEQMMRHILGEDILYETHLAPDLWHARFDPNAFEQVIVNLAVNARDAMPSGGRLTLETQNVYLGAAEAGARGHDIPPGEYVTFIIADSGHGIPEDLREYIFDPFYTTKGPNAGTGLGLSTCYGIVRQAGGYMWFYSEVGQGTTFKVYLPRVVEPLQESPERPPLRPVSGSESILLVEDNQSVREVATRTLRALGYRVTEAQSAEDALEIARESDVIYDLLLTDVVMPGMNGKALADRLTREQPELRVLYMSGYTRNTIVHHGVVDQGVELLQKPFSPRALSERVREVLDGGGLALADT